MKRLVSVFTSLSLILTSVLADFSPAAVTVQAAGFTPRTVEPSADDRYWIHTSAGGLNECVPIEGGSCLPNCVGYAWGRAYELLGSRPDLPKGDAATWYQTNINSGAYPYGTVPKLGAVACWSGDKYGHVAVVEGINDEHSIMFSESSYAEIDSPYRYRFKYYGFDPYNPPNKNLKFEGYIYIGDFSSVPPDYEYEIDGDTATITRYIGKGGDVVIPSEIEGKRVTEIGRSAFYSCKSLTSVTIPDSVTSIGISAFSYCTNLASVTIPGSVRDIGGYAFQFCENLASVTIPEGVASIGNSAFSGCEGLTSVSIPSSIVSFGEFAFNNCTSLVSAVLNKGLTFIGDSAFRGCTALASVTFPDSVTSIGRWAFEGCTSLAAVTIPDGVREIRVYAFYGCTSLAAVTIPDSVTVIGDSGMGTNAFHNCTSLTQINVSENNPNYSSKDGVLFNKDKTTLFQYPAGKAGESYIISDSVTHIDTKAFEHCAFLVSVTIPDSVKYIGTWAFSGCTALTEINIGEKNVYYSSQDGVLFNKYKTELVQYPAGKTNERYIIPNSVTKIGKKAFYKSAFLTSILIPNSVTTIDWNAFEDCTSLTSVTIPASVTWIGLSAFEGCTSLKNAVIPDSVKEIGSYAFEGCSSLTSIELPKGITAIEWFTFAHCTSLASAVIPDSVTSIDKSAFEGCTSLASVVIPDGVKVIDSYTFRDCTSLTSAVIPDSVTIIEESAFEGCPLLTICGYYNSYAQRFAEDNQIPFKIIGKTDKNSGIKIESPSMEGKAFVVEITEDSAAEEIIYNITLKNENGEEVQPEGEVTVKIPLPEGWKQAEVSRRESDGSLTDMKAVCEKGYAVFVTDHFSEYVLAKKPDVQRGEINGDGKLSAVDAKWVLQAVSGSRVLTPEQQAAADVNGDGKINAVDAKWILQAVSGSRVLD